MSDADTFHEQVPDDAEGSDDAKEPADDAEPMDDDAVVDEKDGDESPGGAEKSADKKPGAKRDRAPKPLVPGTMIFPTARVKKMIKLDPEVKQVTNDAVFLIGKATELFLHYYTTEAFKETKRDKRKTLVYKDLASPAVLGAEEFEFLKDLVPQKKLRKDVIDARHTEQ